MGADLHDFPADDVRALLRLLNELHDRDADPPLRRQHLLRRVCQLLPADAALAATLRRAGPSLPWTVASLATHGFPDDAALVHPWLRSLLSRPPLSRLAGRTGATTLVQHEPQHDPPYTPTSRATSRDPATQPAGLPPLFLDITDLIHSLHASPRTRLAYLLTFCRRARSSPCTPPPTAFGPRERDLVHLLHGELAPLYRLELADQIPARPDVEPMTPRMRQTLDLLLAGSSEKQAAARLGLSRHTVHVYVRSLYKHFHVNTRSELLSRFVHNNHHPH